MAVGNATTRDQLEKVLDVLRRTVRYVWLAAVIGVVGGAMSVVFALTRPHEYESEVVLLYREMISQSMLQDRDVHVASAVLSSRYKEMLLSRQNLAKVVEDLKLYPEVVAVDGTMAAADVLRGKVGFRDKGSGTFRITFRGASPQEAQLVTARLAVLLKDEDTRIRREQARVTKDFLFQEKSRADVDLIERQRAQAAFLTQHPEFAEDEKGGGGAAIRSASARKPGGDATLSALERQRDRIQARLRNPDQPVVVSTAGASRSPAKIAAEAKVKAAERDVEVARVDLANKLRSFTEKHPDVLAARNRLAEAERSQRQVVADLATIVDDNPAALSAPFNREVLEAELAKVERELASYRARVTPGSKDKSGLADQLVSIEGEWAALDRAVEEARIRVQALEAKTFTAEITASSEFAESAQLTVIDEAYMPAGPAGKPRKLIALAGLFLFGALGLALAIGLALVDDRIYRRRDLEDLGIAPVFVVVPADKQRRRRNRG